MILIIYSFLINIMNMKHYNKILEAINRGIQFALDDFDPEDIELSKPKQETITKDDSLQRSILKREKFIDLGLPSGTLWCKYNLGVNPNKLDSARYWYGDYYQWGEINSVFNPLVDGYTLNTSIDKTRFSSSSELYDKKYNNKDKILELLPEDDPVYLHYGSLNYHMPTIKQFEELKNNTTKSWVDDYQGIVGLSGLLLKSKNGNEIFFPANGFINFDEFVFEGESPYIWSKNRYAGINGHGNYGPYCMSYHNSGSQYDWISLDWMVREHAACIRPVYNF